MRTSPVESPIETSRRQRPFDSGTGSSSKRANTPPSGLGSAPSHSGSTRRSVFGDQLRFTPACVVVGSEVSLTNESAVEVHELVALPPEELAAFFPRVEAVLVAAPGGDGVVVEGDGVLGEPGRYALICGIPTGADPDEYLEAAAAAEGAPPEVDGGAPHIAAGMYAELVVE